MKLVHASLSGILIKDNQNCMEWIIESPNMFRLYVQEWIRQTEGKEGKFVLSKDDKIQDISKKAMMILDPFSIDINCKKMLTKLYEELKNIAYGEKFYLETQELMQKLLEYILKLENETSHVLNLAQEIDLACVFKAFDLKHEIVEDDFLQILVQYIKIARNVLGIELFLLVNIRSYLDDQQMRLLVREVMYQNIQMICVENTERDCIPNMNRYIIDIDLCEIY